MIEYWTIRDIKEKILEKVNTDGITFFCVNGYEIKHHRRYSIVDVVGDQITLMEWHFKDNGDRWEEHDIVYTNVEAFNKHFTRI